MKFKIKRTFILPFILLGCVVFLSAFAFESHDKLLTRFDLALLIEDILEKKQIRVVADSIPQYSDLDEDRLLTVFRALSLKIMAGYPDGSFRPEEPLRNLETVCYLQKLARCLRSHAPDAYETRQLMRMFAYQSQPEVVLNDNLPAGSFPAELSEAGGFVEKASLQDLLTGLLTENGKLNIALTGKVVNSLTGRPLPGAFVSSGYQAVVTDASGNFRMGFSEVDQPEVTLFAVAEGFQPVELKKDLRLSPTINFRLRPEKRVPGRDSIRYTKAY